MTRLLRTGGLVLLTLNPFHAATSNKTPAIKSNIGFYVIAFDHYHSPAFMFLDLFLLHIWLLFVCILGRVTSNGYDTNPAQFHPSGRILQTEYAKKAVATKGGPACAIRCIDGILLATARRIKSNKLSIRAARKVYFIDKHIAIAASGLLFESMQIIDIAKKEAARYKEIYATPIPVELLCDYIANIMHLLTREASYRPLGIGLLVCGWDDTNGPQIFSTDPEGSFTGWNAVAIGSQREKIMGNLVDLVKKAPEKANPHLGGGGSVEQTWPKFNQILNKCFKFQSNDNLEASIGVSGYSSSSSIALGTDNLDARADTESGDDSCDPDSVLTGDWEVEVGTNTFTLVQDYSNITFLCPIFLVINLVN
jgi:20S proteasome alpha/beta subunit